MKIGIAGLGNVGNACRHGFLSIGHTVFVHDIKLGTSIHDIVNTEIVYICVPTPMGTSQQCDTSIVDHVISSLTDLDYQGIIAIKSTVNPGYTDAQLEKTKLSVALKLLAKEKLTKQTSDKLDADAKLKNDAEQNQIQQRLVYYHK